MINGKQANIATLRQELDAAKKSAVRATAAKRSGRRGQVARDQLRLLEKEEFVRWAKDIGGLTAEGMPKRLVPVGDLSTESVIQLLRFDRRCGLGWTATLK